MIERFQNNEQALLDLLKRQFNSNNLDVAKAIRDVGEISEISAGTVLIVENGPDNDIYFIVTGSVKIEIKGNFINTIQAGHYVGEMSAIEPSQVRSATVTANETTVVVKVKADDFINIADTFPKIVWRYISEELSRRLLDRNKLIGLPNDKPKLFIMSSVEGLKYAYAVQQILEHDILSTVWAQGVFWAGSFTLDELEKVVEDHDFGLAIGLMEDIIEAREAKKPGMRDNVLFELGMFMGRLGRNRSILLHPRVKNLSLPSDLAGLTTLSFAPGEDKELVNRLGPACNHIRQIIARNGVRTVAQKSA